MQSTSLPEQDMAIRLAGQVGSGTFEAHLTVAADDLAARERFRAVCVDLGVKCVLIELPAGHTRSQPMTSTYHHGDLPDVVREVSRLAGELRRRGFAPTRVKLEAVITNTGVPATDDEARAFPAGNYFEFHVKLALAPDADLDALRVLCERQQAHLSSNALKRDEAGRSERFVTQRVHGVGRTNAEAVFERLVTDLLAAGYTLSNRLREYTIFDSNIAIDAGWIDEPDDDHD